METKAYVKYVKKEAAPQLLRIAGFVGGFVVAHVVKKNVALLNSLVGDAAFTTAGAAGAIGIMADNDGYSPLHFAKDVSCGVAGYGIISGVGRLGMPVAVTGIKGLGGVSLPESIRKPIASIWPNLNLSGVSLAGMPMLNMVQDQRGVYQLAGEKTIEFPDPYPMPEQSNNLLGIAC